VIPDFKNEAEFRTAWLGPFLQKMGYLLVTQTHGADEQGKDFIFADFDKFDHIRYYAGQAKLGDIGVGTSEIDKLLDQIKRAFRVQIKNRSGADERRISAVYIFASGKISSQAREYITEHCRSEPYGENVYYLDGDRLERLDRYINFRTDQELLTQLRGILSEAGHNLRTAQMIKDEFASAEQKVFPMRSRTSAFDQMLNMPVATELLDFNLLLQVSPETGYLNQVCESWGFLKNSAKQIPDHWLRPFQDYADAALEQNRLIYNHTNQAIQELQKKYHLEVEIIDSV
jgi:hypothetical protein